MPEQKIDFHADVEVYFCYLMIIIIKYDFAQTNNRHKPLFAEQSALFRYLWYLHKDDIPPWRPRK